MSDLSAFLEQLSSSQPVPGGGSVAALETAAAAALLAMVANLTIGKKKYVDVQERVEELRDRSIELRDRAERLVDDDAQAYGRVHEAMKLPKGSDAEIDTRRQGIQEALKGAALPPLATMRVACQVLDLALPLAEMGNRSAISDVGSAALSAQAGFYAARLNVQINLESVRDENWAADTRERMEALGSPDSTVKTVLQRVEAVILGEAS